MSSDNAGTANLDQLQASKPIANVVQKQIHPSVKFNPRQESRESAENPVHDSRRSQISKTVEDAPTVEATRGGL